MQFWPRKPSAKTATRYSGRLKIKFMVQARQFRSDHVDAHYASALYRYLKEFSIKFRDYVSFVSMDDKHTLKVGEPGCPVAAAERGKAVLVAMGQRMTVADHDFTRLSITPSVTLLIDVPETIEETFHQGRVSVVFHENAFEPSSPIRHMADLKSVLNDMDSDNRILLLYTDGGPDHRLTYLSVQLCLVAVFINLDVDFLCAVRTPPKHSWKNPVERIMSIINLGLQGIGLMRQEVVHEAELKRCGSLKSIRTMADKVPGMKEEVIQSVEPIMELLSSFMKRLRLKEHSFKTYSTASEDEMTNLWNSVLEVDASLTKDDRTKQHLKRKDQLKGFLDTHCRVRQYMFSILKCQSPECTVCKAPRLPPDVFQQIQHLPDPVPTGNRYQAFDDLYGKVETTEEYLPSNKAAAPKGHGCPFNPTAQTAKNVGVVTQCEECGKWRCLHAQRKLKEKAREALEILMENVLYNCGSVLKDIDNEGDDTSVLSDVHVRANLNCNTPIELSYYTAGYELICYYCGAVDDLVEQDGYYPQCNNCEPKDKVSKRGKNFHPRD